MSHSAVPYLYKKHQYVIKNYHLCLFRIVKKTDSPITNKDIHYAKDCLCTLMKRLASVHPLPTPNAVNKLNYDQLKTNNNLSGEIMQEIYGFTIGIDTSRIMNGGRGVFIKQGTVKKGHIVALYPGKPDHTHLVAC